VYAPLVRFNLRQTLDLAPGIAAPAFVIVCSYAAVTNEQRIAQAGLWLLLMVLTVNLLGSLAARTPVRF
jgi:hypothetical protein